MPFRVLCAFQTDEIFDFVKSALSIYECELLKATSESLALFLVQKNFPCLIICQLDADENWGRNLLSNLKAEPEFAGIPFVFLEMRQGDLKQAKTELPLGADLLIAYPVETYEFRLLVEKFLADLADDRIPETPE